MDAFGEYFQTSLYFKSLDYTSPTVQSRIVALQKDATSLKRTTTPTVSWLEDFLSWASRDSRYNGTSLDADGYFSDSSQFYTALDDFLADSSYAYHYDNLRFNDAGEIKTSKINAWHKKVGTTSEKVSAMLELRKECEDTKLSPKPFPYTFAYVFIEQFVIIYWELVLNLILSLVACAVSYYY